MISSSIGRQRLLTSQKNIQSAAKSLSFPVPHGLYVIVCTSSAVRKLAMQKAVCFSRWVSLV
jgi:hypothetical protein